MIIQYDDIVLQVVARLRAVIPQSPTKIADIVVMENFQKQIDNFLKSGEQSKIMVTYSGNEAEGGREIAAFVRSIDGNTQYISHTVEVHICTKRYMYEDLTKPANTMLRLMYAVRAGLVGLKMYERETTAPYAVKFGEALAACTEGMMLIETFIDRNHEGLVVAVCRFQVMEMVAQAEDVAPETIWGTYREITFEEYSQAEGTTPNPTGTGDATTEVTAPETE